jgi:SAM-dependent methyltransferase
MVDYSLRISDGEVVRYRRMADAARRDEAELWALAGIVPGARIVDLGCGPGATLLGMAEVVGPAGSVLGVDGDPQAVAAAQALIRASGLGNAEARLGDLADSAIEPASMDVAVMRHVLAHNGPTEQALVDHAASLVRPGGCVYLFDIDATMLRRRPEVPLLVELWERYTAFHAARGNDLQVGLRLGDLLAAAGLDLLVYTARANVLVPRDGTRPPAWAARDAMLAAGVIDAGDVARWERGLLELDAAASWPQTFFIGLIAVGRRP